MIVLDTNVVAELMRASPTPAVAGWVRDRASTGDRLYTTAISVAEIAHGVARLPKGRRKQALQAAAEDLFATFSGQVLAFEAVAGQMYGKIVADRDRLGVPISGFDAQIAATCRAHDATLATRNVRDFRHTGIEILDPWT